MSEHSLGTREIKRGFDDIWKKLEMIDRKLDKITKHLKISDDGK